MCRIGESIRKNWKKWQEFLNRIKDPLTGKKAGQPAAAGAACSVSFDKVKPCAAPPGDQSAIKCHGNCWTADTLVHGVDGLRPIPAFKIGDRVLTYTAEERADFAPPDVPEADITGWRVVELELDRPDGTVAEVSLLRSPEWIAERTIEPGAKLFLDLPEMDVEGDAIVIAGCHAHRSG